MRHNSGSWTHPWPVRLCSLRRRSSLGTQPGQVAQLACSGTISHACLPALKARKLFGEGAGDTTGQLLGPPFIDLEGQLVLVARNAGLETTWKRQDGAPRIGDQQSSPTGRECVSCRWRNASRGQAPPSGASSSSWVTVALSGTQTTLFPELVTTSSELACTEHLPCQALPRRPSSQNSSAGGDR